MDEMVAYKGTQGTFLVVQWLRLGAFNAGGTGLIPGLGTKILHDTWCGQKKIILIKNF